MSRPRGRARVSKLFRSRRTRAGNLMNYYYLRALGRRASRNAHRPGGSNLLPSFATYFREREIFSSARESALLSSGFFSSARSKSRLQHPGAAEVKRTCPNIDTTTSAFKANLLPLSFNRQMRESDIVRCDNRRSRCYYHHRREVATGVCGISCILLQHDIVHRLRVRLPPCNETLCSFSPNLPLFAFSSFFRRQCHPSLVRPRWC